ncbi:MAG TPA: hypothetical protein DC054_23730 [Blastocatellia bacterium]|nr:hypothetical protein [Blastocatellia bacterium]
MNRIFLLTWLTVGVIAPQAFGQEVANQKPNEAEVATAKRQLEILRHPSGVITIRLAALGREPATTPPPYTVDNWMHFQMFESQNSGEDLTYWDDRDAHYAYRPELIRDGDTLSYTKQAQEFVERTEREPGGNGFTRAPVTIASGKEYPGHYVNLKDWYEWPLKLGHYQLTIKKQFLPNGGWVVSNPVTFDVGPRRAASPIPDGFYLRLTPAQPKGESTNQPYRLGYDEGVLVEMVNDSDQRAYVTVIDRYYGNRPQLIKDGQVIPYSDEITKLIESKEKDPRLVEVVKGFYIDPKAPPRVEGFSLKQWYGPLAPGAYHLTDRRRFEIGGPWTKDSAELVIEILP